MHPLEGSAHKWSTMPRTFYFVFTNPLPFDREQGLAPFLDRCRAQGLSLVLLLDEPLEKLPVEACSALNGIRSVSRDLSLHMLRHR